MSDLIEQLSPPRAVWVMVPAGDITGKTIDELATHIKQLATRRRQATAPAIPARFAQPAPFGVQ